MGSGFPAIPGCSQGGPTGPEGGGLTWGPKPREPRAHVTRDPGDLGLWDQEPWSPRDQRHRVSGAQAPPAYYTFTSEAIIPTGPGSMGPGAQGTRIPWDLGRMDLEPKRSVAQGIWSPGPTHLLYV